MFKQIKSLFVVALLLGLCVTTYAQNTITHIVKRGETISGIAKKYGTTEREITRLNNLIYEGMELTLPAADNQGPELDIHRTESVRTSREIRNENEGAETKKVKKISPFDFSNYGVSYMASFDFADQGYYTIGGPLYTEKIGLDLFLGWNMGLAPSGYEGFIFGLGPNYSYVLNDNILISASTYFIGTYTSTGPDEVRKMNDIEKEFEFDWGIALEPRITFKLGKVFPYVGLPIQWAKGSSSLSVAFHIGVGFKI